MKRSWKIPVITIILIVIVNIICFFLTFRKTPTFWISDIAVVLAVIAQIPISGIAFKNNSSLTSKVYGWPIISVGFRFLAMIAGSAVILIILSGNIENFPIAISIAVYGILYGTAAIGLIVSDNTRNFIETQDVRLDDQTVVMRKLYAEAAALKGRTGNREIIGIVTNVAEWIRFSDPVSCPEVFEQESRLHELLGELKEEAKANNTEKVKELSREFKEQLDERNTMCKYAKRGH